jgi:hypothetical protein
MKVPRFRIAWVMVFVFVIAVILWLGIPATEVYTCKEYHVHEGTGSSKDSAVAQAGIPAPFWPRYWRRLAGHPWRKQPCDVRVGLPNERCELPMNRWKPM